MDDEDEEAGSSLHLDDLLDLSLPVSNRLTNGPSTSYSAVDLSSHSRDIDSVDDGVAPLNMT